MTKIMQWLPPNPQDGGWPPSPLATGVSQDGSQTDWTTSEDNRSEGTVGLNTGNSLFIPPSPSDSPVSSLNLPTPPISNLQGPLQLWSTSGSWTPELESRSSWELNHLIARANPTGLPSLRQPRRVSTEISPRILSYDVIPHSSSLPRTISNPNRSARRFGCIGDRPEPESPVVLGLKRRSTLSRRIP